ncbi:hypothetical protein DFH06DRAFT_1481167 [Mycena polygramma]|nr:hypothetical protein DFH06DRAFT_1481167 [Mycena polygramma]
MALASIPKEILRRRWRKSYEGKFPNIIFNPILTQDMWVDNVDPDLLLCFATFNVSAEAMNALQGAEGEAFINAAKEVLKIEEDEEKTL